MRHRPPALLAAPGSNTRDPRRRCECQSRRFGSRESLSRSLTIANSSGALGA